MIDFGSFELWLGIIIGMAYMVAFIKLKEWQFAKAHSSEGAKK